MKNLLKFAAIFALLPMIMLTSCSDDDTPDPVAENQFDVLKQYMIDNNMDVTDVLASWTTTATNVYDAMTDADATNDVFIIDIRKADDFAANRIEWAVNSPLADVVAAADQAGGKPIVVVCYTGQTAGHAAMALRLSGYADTKVMMWGMCSWNPATATAWNNAIANGNTAVGDPNWAVPTGEIVANTPMTAPEILYTTTDGAEILKEQVSKMLNAGFKTVTNVDVLGAPTNYFINNYWAATDVEHYGNIKTAHRINPLTLANGEYAYLDGTGKVVTYCWTGQTSSMMTAYLSVMGYDAYSLTYGANGLIYDNLESHKFSAAATMDYPLTSGGK
jgi:rhodanese-related sulfurtransferase